MSSDEQKKDKVIQAKKFYLEEEIYQQIINGFESAKERELVDKKNMPVILRVQQLIRLKLSSPYMFGGFFQAQWFKGIFEKEYQVQKKKKMKDIRQKFYYAWYDLEWWFSKLEGDEQQFQAEKDKDKHHFNFWKAYKRISKMSRWYKAIKVFVQSCKNSESLKALFGENYNLLNERDYRRFQANLNWAVQDIQNLFVPSIMVLLQPIMKRVSYLYAKTLQQLYDRFCWWLIKTILWGTAWWEVAISIVGYAASFFSYGAAGGAMIAARIASMSAKLANIFGKFFTIGTRLIGSSSRIMRGVGRVSQFTAKGFRAGGNLLMKGSAKMNTWGKGVWQGARSGKYKTATRAFMRRHPKKLKFSKMAITGGVAIALFYYDDEHYNRVHRQIRRRTGIMYKGVEEHLVNLRNSGEMIGDISSFLGSVGETAFNNYMNRDSKINASEYRTNKLYKTKLKIKESQFDRTVLFRAMRSMRKYLSYYKDTIKNSLQFIVSPLSDKVFGERGQEKSKDNRLIYSQGFGKFGIALYKNQKRLVFENITFNGNQKSFFGDILYGTYFGKIVLTQKVEQGKINRSVGVYIQKQIGKHGDQFGWKSNYDTFGHTYDNRYYAQNFEWIYPSARKFYSSGLKSGFKVKLPFKKATKEIYFQSNGGKFVATVDGKDVSILGNNLSNKGNAIRIFDRNGKNTGNGDYTLTNYETWLKNLETWTEIKTPVYTEETEKSQLKVQQNFKKVCYEILRKIKEKISLQDDEERAKVKRDTVLTTYKSLQSIDFYKYERQNHQGDYIYKSFEGKHRLGDMSDDMRTKIQSSSQEELDQMIVQLKDLTSEKNIGRDTSYDGTNLHTQYYHMNYDINASTRNIIMKDRNNE